MESWTGVETPIVQYQKKKERTTIPFHLAAAQMTIVAFKKGEAPLTYDILYIAGSLPQIITYRHKDIL
jgi:hypothetical protein